MAKTLSADAFPEFFAAVHGFEPFPWQSRLAKQVLEERRWPGVLDLPTGVGKTAALDVAVFALAIDAQRGAERRAPLRTVFVVDRRVVVDQAYEHACELARALDVSETGIVRRVRDILTTTFGCERSVEVAVLRGGIPRDDGWARSPAQPLIAVSTVDQVGSRLLFRGYGLSDRMKPIHAGLLGQDTLFLLDEVHLAAPFAATLSAIQERYRVIGPLAVDRWSVVCMSATPIGVEGAEVFGLKKADGEHPVLRKRIEASKPARLVKKVEVGNGDEDSRRSRLARACSDAVDELLISGLRTVLVVVNRVDTARKTWEHLAGRADLDTHLLTGRMRPIDKDRVAKEVIARIGAKRDRTLTGRPIVVVATQSIEAGADLDVEGLVTECASIDALRQRFGRLNRRGEYERCAALILVRTDQASKSPDDPVYGSALAATWKWLESKGRDLDVGVRALTLTELERADLVPPTPQGPVLLPGHLDLWAQTCPVPYPDPEVAHWLHGCERGVPDIQVIWRSDVTEERLRRAVTDENECEALRADVSAVRPGSVEALAVPLHAAREWLVGEAVVGGSDSESEHAPQAPWARDRERKGRPFLRWKGDDSTVSDRPFIDLAPGDTIVVPATYGGLRAGNWDPSATDVVSDLGDLVQWIQRGRATLRLDPQVIGPWLVKSVNTDVDSDSDVDDRIDEVLDTLVCAPTLEGGAWVAAAAVELRNRKRRRPPIELGTGAWLLTSRKQVERRPPGTTEQTFVDETTEDETSAFVGARVTLRDHSTHVETHARDFAERCGLGEPLVNDLAFAGWLHDVGKIDPRFQQILCGGNEVASAMLDEPLAKSDIPKLDARARERARSRAGYPRGTRHELMSVALIQGVDSLRARAEDWDLVLHLVASHHGWCRPFPPAVEDPSGPEEIAHRVAHSGWKVDVRLVAATDHSLARLDSGIAERFWSLVRKYGWFGLAYLEALLRLADHRASEDEQEAKS